MILTGKCKEDFIKWVKKRCNIKLHELMKVEMWFSIQDEALKNALIIEFFDSVDMKIGYIPIIGGDFETYVNVDKYDVYNIDHRFEARQEATTQAIKKANEIYNETALHNQA